MLGDGAEHCFKQTVSKRLVEWGHGMAGGVECHTWGVSDSMNVRISEIEIWQRSLCLSGYSGRVSCTSLVAYDCRYPLSRYSCRATRVAADFLDFIAFCRCSSGPWKFWCRTFPPPPPFPGGVAPLKFGSEKVSRYTGVSQLQLRVSRYTVQLSAQVRPLGAL